MCSLETTIINVRARAITKRQSRTFVTGWPFESPVQLSLPLASNSGQVKVDSPYPSGVGGRGKWKHPSIEPKWPPRPRCLLPPSTPLSLNWLLHTQQAVITNNHHQRESEGNNKTSEQDFCNRLAIWVTCPAKLAFGIKLWTGKGWLLDESNANHALLAERIRTLTTATGKMSEKGSHRFRYSRGVLKHLEHFAPFGSSFWRAYGLATGKMPEALRAPEVMWQGIPVRSAKCTCLSKSGF